MTTCPGYPTPCFDVPTTAARLGLTVDELLGLDRAGTITGQAKEDARRYTDVAIAKFERSRADGQQP